MVKNTALYFVILFTVAAGFTETVASADDETQSPTTPIPPSVRMGSKLYETIQKVADYFKRQQDAGPNVAIWPGNPMAALQEFEGKKAADLQSVEEFARATNDPWEKQVAYYVLITQPVASGDIELSMEYLSRLKKEYPSSPILEGFRIEDLDKLQSTYREYKRILAQQLSKDEELWRLANLFHEGLQLEFNTADEFFYDLRFPESLLEKIAQQYPKSPWADDAEYRLIEWGDTRDCCADLELIPVYEAFIKKYPDSDLVPEARLNIAYEYKAFVEWGDELGHSATGEQVWEYLEKARRIVSDVLKKYPTAQTASRTRDFLNEIQCMLEGRALQLHVRLSKESWAIGEPIEVTVELVSSAPIDIMIQIDPKPPNFTLSVFDSVGNPITFRTDPEKRISDRFKPTDWLLIDNGGKYSERCILQENCLSNDSPRIKGIRSVGGFILDKAGNYHLYARYLNGATGCSVESVRVIFFIGP